MNKKYSSNKLQIPFYKQTLPTSCGSSSLLMVENFFDPSKYPLSKAREEEIHNYVRFGKTEMAELEDLARVANVFLENEFRVTFFLKGPLFKPQEISETTWQECLDFFEEGLVTIKEHQNGTLITTDFSTQEIIKEIDKGNPCICETNYSKPITHIVIVRGYRGNSILIIDPMRGYRVCLRDDFEKDINLGFMKNFFSVSKTKN